jgi:uncharacterized protein YbjT (DUF2867 family)
MGADPGSRIFYSRVKGELEEAIKALGFAGLVIARPSLLLGDRNSLCQSPRFGERLASLVDHLAGRWVPANFRGIAAADVARALLARVPTAERVEVLLSGAMQRGRSGG